MALYFSPSVRYRFGWLMTRTRGWSNTSCWAGVIVQDHELAMNIGLTQE